MAGDPNFYSNVPTALIGLAIVSLNIAVTSTILIVRRLRTRTELRIFSALSFADLLCGYAYMIQSVRSMMLATKTTSISPSECLKILSVHANVIGPEFLTMMMLVISIDRLISVASIKTYKSLGPWYLLVAIGVPVVASIGSYGTVWYRASMDNGTIDSVCSIVPLGGRVWYLYHSIIQLVCSAASVVVCMLILLLFKRQRNRISTLTHIMDPGETRQLQMTKTVGLMCICTFLLYVLPSAGLIYLGYFYAGMGSPFAITAGTVCRTIISAYSCINIIVFLTRSSDVRKSMKVICERLKRSRKTVEPTQDVSDGVPMAVIKTSTHGVTIFPLPGTKLMDLDIGVRRPVQQTRIIAMVHN